MKKKQKIIHLLKTIHFEINLNQDAKKNTFWGTQKMLLGFLEPQIY